VARPVRQKLFARRVKLPDGQGGLFSEEKWKGVYIPAKKAPPGTPPDLREMIRRIAMLGGFLGR